MMEHTWLTLWWIKMICCFVPLLKLQNPVPKKKKTANVTLNWKKCQTFHSTLHLQRWSLKHGLQMPKHYNKILLPWWRTDPYMYQIYMQRLSSPVIFLCHAPIMQVPSPSQPLSKAALFLFLFIFSSIVLVYLLLKATVQGSTEIIREAHSVSSLSASICLSLLSPALFFCPAARLGVWEAGR